MRKAMVISIAMLASGAMFFGCSKGTTSTTGGSTAGIDGTTSASALAASAVGGTISSTESTPTMGRLESRPPVKNPLWLLFSEGRAFASNNCPTLLTASGSGCTDTGVNIVSLAYSNCSFPGSTATFNGTDAVEATAGISCGAYPTVPDGNYLAHQYVGTRTSSNGITVDINGTDGTNYTGTNTNSTGEAVFFTGGVRSSITIYGVRYKATGLFDHTLGQYFSTGLSLSVSGSSRTVNGSLDVYHNLEKVTGTVTFTNVVYTTGCCQPTGGSISTSFAAGTNGNASSPYVGKSETLAFSGTCGQGSFTDITGTTSTITMTHCL